MSQVKRPQPIYFNSSEKPLRRSNREEHVHICDIVSCYLPHQLALALIRKMQVEPARNEYLCSDWHGQARWT